MILICYGGTNTLSTHHRPVLNSTAEGAVGAFHAPGRTAKETCCRGREAPVLDARNDPTHWDPHAEDKPYHKISLVYAQPRTNYVCA